MAEETRVRSMILLVELQNGDVHQAILSKQQETGIKSVLQALPDNLQLLATKLDLEIRRADPVAQDEVKSDDQADVPQ